MQKGVDKYFKEKRIFRSKQYKSIDCVGKMVNFSAVNAFFRTILLPEKRF
jgi:hypothetical protein